MLRLSLSALLLFASVAEARPIRLCVIGDSISEGFSPATRGWSSYLVAAHAGEDFSAKNVSESGNKVADAQLVFDKEVAGTGLRGCTHVAFLIGTNDLPDGTAAATIYAAVDTMATAAEAQGARVLLLAILPRGTGASWSSGLQTRLEATNTLYAARSGSTFADTYTALLEPASSPPALATAAGGATDGLHPNNTGEALIAATVDCAAEAAGLWVAAASSGCP